VPGSVDVARSAAPARRWLLPLQLLAAAVGAWQGLGFGEVISGPGLGALLAVNGALFGSLAVPMLADLGDRLAQALRSAQR
jgi:hypothetical protein